MTFTTLLLLGMLVAVFAIAGRIWWAIRVAERRHRQFRESTGHARRRPTATRTTDRPSDQATERPDD